MAEVLAIGLAIGISGPVTFPKADVLREVARTVPVERLLVETDCPYLTPVPYRGRRNEPAYVRYVVEAVARERGIEACELAATTTANAQRVFRLL
jgi:TatD DNase family protein